MGVPALGLGHDLLRHHQHVAGPEPRVRTFQRREDQRGQVVARLDQRNAGERDEFEAPRRHAPLSPVIRMPA